MRTLATLIILAIFCQTSISQTNSMRIDNSEAVPFSTAQSLTLTKPGIVPDNVSHKKAVKAGLDLKLDITDLDTYLQYMGESDRLVVRVSLTAFDVEGQPLNDVFTQTDYELVLDFNNHTNVLSKDFTRYLNYLVGVDNDITTIFAQLNYISTSDATATDSPDPLILGAVSLIANYYIDYGIDVRYDGTVRVAPPANLSSTLIPGTRTVSLSWDHSFPYSAYELQVAHMPNIDYEGLEGTSTYYRVDWDNAAKLIVPVETLDNTKRVIETKTIDAFRLINGTGVYVWRVRPIGGYYDGGFANSKNYGRWTSRLNGPNVLFDQVNGENTYWFFLEDPDDEVNTIRSRIFTEDLKIKEVNTYADGLQNVKQTQVNIPSNNTTIITQTEQDFSGRNALTTIPVPLGYETDNFQENVLMNDDGEAYSAKDFDDPEGTGVPSEALQDGAFSYYNDNPDKRIANTEGYPFSRTLFYNDGLSRVKEQSAPGNAFAIKEDQTGHTIRYLYGTASESELVRIFGSDAPNARNVSKTVVIDQNNVSTTTYKTSDGNVIATCLNISDNEEGALLPVDGTGDEVFSTIVESINTNVSTDYGFYSSKRIVIPQKTDLNIYYEVSNKDLDALCTRVNGGCEYLAEVIVYDLWTNELFYTTTPTLVSANNPIDQTIEDIPAGSYMIAKKLYLDGTGVSETELRSNIELQVNTLSDVVEHWLTMANCFGGAVKYYQCLNLLSSLANNSTLHLLDDNLSDPANGLTDFTFEGTTIRWSEFEDMYEPDEFPKEDFEVILYQMNESGSFDVMASPATLSNPPDYLYIKTGSCCNQWVPAKFLETFDFSQDAVINPDGSVYPDFEAYAQEFMRTCDLGEGKNLYDYMDGWPKGTLNLMVYHMLTDDYSRDNPLIEEDEDDGAGDEEPELDECGVPIEESCADGSCYDMRELFDCWQSTLIRLKDELGCTDAPIEVAVDSEEGFADAIDDDNNDEEGAEQDGHYDDNFDMKGIRGWLAKRKAKKKISKMIRGMSTNDDDEVQNPATISAMHLVKEFLNCSGYQFAKILTGFDPYPMENIVDPSKSDKLDIYTYHTMVLIPLSGYYPVLTVGVSDIETYLSDSEYKKGNDYYYVPIQNWDPKKYIIVEGEDEPVATEESLFPNIRNPIFAFKYFEYQGHGQPGYVALEQQTCFDDPNDCFLLDESSEPDYDPLTGIVNWIPCCVNNLDHEDYSFCHKDYNYPLLENLTAADIAADARFGSDIDGNFRWVVDEFVGYGRIRCPYTHEFWSSGQRFTFYNSLKNYTPVIETFEEPEYVELCSDMLPGTGRTPTWVRNGSGEIFDEAFLTAYDFDLTGYEEINYPDYFYPGAETVNGEPREDRTITRLELEMSITLKQCKNTCDEKEEEIHTTLNEVLTTMGYNIGGCISPETPWNIPPGDVIVMVETLVEECKSQCAVTTFACEEKSLARMTFDDKQVTGATISNPHAYLHLGISADPTAVCELPELSGYADCGLSRTSYQFVSDASTPTVTEIDLSVIDRSTLSWYEYTMLQQAIYWRLNISIDPAEGSDAEKEFDCAAGSNTTFIDKDVYEIPPALPDAVVPGQTDLEVESTAKELIIEVTDE